MQCFAELRTEPRQDWRVQTTGERNKRAMRFVLKHPGGRRRSRRRRSPSTQSNNRTRTRRTSSTPISGRTHCMVILLPGGLKENGTGTSPPTTSARTRFNGKKADNGFKCNWVNEVPDHCVQSIPFHQGKPIEPMRTKRWNASSPSRNTRWSCVQQGEQRPTPVIQNAMGRFHSCNVGKA